MWIHYQNSQKILFGKRELYIQSKYYILKIMTAFMSGKTQLLYLDKIFSISHFVYFCFWWVLVGPFCPSKSLRGTARQKKVLKLADNAAHTAQWYIDTKKQGGQALIGTESAMFNVIAWKHYEAFLLVYDTWWYLNYKYEFLPSKGRNQGKNIVLHGKFIIFQQKNLINSFFILVFWCQHLLIKLSG